MKDFSEWKKVYEDSDFVARFDPRDPDGYGALVKKTQDLLRFPNKTLMDIARSNRDSAKNALETLFPYTFQDGKIIGTDLTPDSVIAIAKHIYFKEEIEYLGSQLSDLRASEATSEALRSRFNNEDLYLE